MKRWEESEWDGYYTRIDEWVSFKIKLNNWNNSNSPMTQWRDGEEEVCSLYRESDCYNKTVYKISLSYLT